MELLCLILPAATSLRSLKYATIGYPTIGDDGASALAAILKETQITNLECAEKFAYV